MSSDSQPSFRTYSKKKLKKIFAPNITSSSIRERIISNETYQKIVEKPRNYTNTIIEQTGLDKFINKTKSWIPDTFTSDNNSTSSKGFFDSLFYPQTVNDVYLKAAIICLWVIAMLCILTTIITIFISVIKTRGKTMNVKMIFFHLFLCEFCYLIYILLSMINVGQDFQLNSFWCDIAKYGMYATVPVMYLALLILSIERMTTQCDSQSSGIIGMLTNICIIQPILILIWIIAIGIISGIIYYKNRVKGSIIDLSGKIVPKRLSSSFGNIFSSDRCSIDGQLLPPFKILFLILFIILIVLIIKSMVFSRLYSFFKPSCCKPKKKEDTSDKNNITLIFIIILLLNLIFSFPFYFISTGSSIAQMVSGDTSFSMKLKISFILRLSSIIFQCFVFFILESTSWNLLNKLLHYVMCKKFGINGNITNKNKSDRDKKPRSSISSETDADSDDQKPMTNAHENNRNTKLPVTDESDDDDDDGDDDVFLKDSKNVPSKPKKSETTDEDNSDNEKQKLSMKKKDITNKLPQKTNKIVNETLLNKRPTTKNNNSNGISKPTSNGKTISQPTCNGKTIAQPISSVTTDKKTSKSNANENRTRYNSTSSDTPSDNIPNVNVNSTNKIKPTVIKPKISSPSNKQYRSHYRRYHGTTYSRVTRPITTTPRNHKYTKTTTHRSKSPRNINNHQEKPTQDRLSKILAISIEV